jgi:hypothetical protein
VSSSRAGGVQIDYGSYKLVADRVEYDQNSGRMRAFGSVEMIEPTGNRIYADDLDITDDFADGFVNALRIETPDNTRIAAESAERSGGVETTFNNGVYTACEACEDDPERAPLWQVKAQRVIQNGETKTIRLEQATFELFGMPIAYLPYLESARSRQEAQDRLPDALLPHCRQPRIRRFGAVLRGDFALYGCDLHRHRLHQPGLPGRGRIPAEFRQWRAHAAHGRHLADEARRIHCRNTPTAWKPNVA